MPLYSYDCHQCRKTETRLRYHKNRDRKVACPKCGNRMTRREFETFATPGQMPATPTQATHHQLGHPNLKNVTIRNVNTGMVVENTSVAVDGLKVQGARKAIVGRNAKIKGTNIDIE